MPDHGQASQLCLLASVNSAPTAGHPRDSNSICPNSEYPLIYPASSLYKWTTERVEVIMFVVCAWSFAPDTRFKIPLIHSEHLSGQYPNSEAGSSRRYVLYVSEKEQKFSLKMAWKHPCAPVISTKWKKGCSDTCWSNIAKSESKSLLDSFLLDIFEQHVQQERLVQGSWLTIN